MKDASTAAIIKAADLSALTGLSDRRHRQIADMGYFPAPQRSSFDLWKSIQGLFRFYRENRPQHEYESITSEKRLSWTMEWAAAEWGINPRTLTARLKQSGITGTAARGPSGHDRRIYSTKQICTAVFGDLELERIRKTKEEADQLAMANELERRRLVPAEDILKRLLNCATRMRIAVESSALDEEKQGELLNTLADLGAEL